MIVIANLPQRKSPLNNVVGILGFPDDYESVFPLHILISIKNISKIYILIWSVGCTHCVVLEEEITPLVFHKKEQGEHQEEVHLTNMLMRIKYKK